MPTECPCHVRWKRIRHSCIPVPNIPFESAGVLFSSGQVANQFGHFSLSTMTDWLPCAPAAFVAVLGRDEVIEVLGHETSTAALRKLRETTYAGPQSLRTVWNDLLDIIPDDCCLKMTSPFQGKIDLENSELLPLAQIIFIPSGRDSRTGHFVVSPGTCKSGWNLWNMCIFVSQNRKHLVVSFSSLEDPQGEGVGSKIMEKLERIVSNIDEFIGKAGDAVEHLAEHYGSQMVVQSISNTKKPFWPNCRRCFAFWQSWADGCAGILKNLAKLEANSAVYMMVRSAALAVVGGSSSIALLSAATTPFAGAGVWLGIGVTAYTAACYADEYIIKPVANFTQKLIGSGLEGGGGPGGVEIRHVALLGFRSDPFTIMTKSLHVFYPVDVNWETLQELMQRLCPGMSAKKVPGLILREIMWAMCACKAPVLFSLHFRKDSALYPVMHHAWQKTLTGHVLGFLDYFLKSFINGGTFSEEFLWNWNGDPDTEKLKTNAIDLRAYLRQARAKVKQSNDKEAMKLLDFHYQPLRQMVPHDEESEKEQQYLSAFRIIGELRGLQQDSQGNAVVEPDAGFKVEYDLDPLPARQAELLRAAAQNGGEWREEVDTLFTPCQSSLTCFQLFWYVCMFIVQQFFVTFL